MKKIDYSGNKNIISTQLKLHRVKNHLSQDMLAAKMQTLGVNMDQQMISRIESNKRIVTDYELACFCKILKTDANDMLSDFFCK